MRKEIILGGTRVAADTAPYVIAEIGVNHEGSLDRAKELIDHAHQGGAQAAKFQTYKAEKISSKNSPAYWDLKMEPTTSQFKLFQKHDKFGETEYLELAEHSKKVGIDFLSTPFDAGAVDFLAPLMPFFKIASADLTNTPFLRQVAAKNKPVVLSVGASTLGEIDVAVRELRDHGATDIALLQCILNYPTAYEDANLNMISGLINTYPDTVIGLSDHTLADPDMMVLTAGYLKGARIIEKHFTFDKSFKGSDHRHSMDLADLKKFSQNISFVRSLEGETHKAPLESETIPRLNARRSIVLGQSVSAGQAISEDMITYKRPGHGISPLHWDDVIGMQAARDLQEDHILQWQDLVAREPAEA